MALYLMGSGPQQTTAAFAVVATSAVIKTLMQFKPSATVVARIVEWGISFDGSSAATPGKVELIETDVAATVTAYATADITKFDTNALSGGDPVTNLIQVGTTSSGYGPASAEGSITAVRNFDIQLISPTNQYVKQWPLGREPMCQVGKFVRIRVTFGTTVNAYAYMIVEI